MKKALVLALVALFALSVAVSADTASKTFAPGLHLIGVPLVPFYPTPTTVFNGVDINGMLTRWDPISSSYIDYFDWTWQDPGGYGYILIGDGAWFQAGDTVTVSYNGVPDGVPDTNNVKTDMWISLPKAGPTFVGMPFDHNVYLRDCSITDGTQTLSYEEAANAGWVDPLVVGYDQNVGYIDVGYDDWREFQILQKWNGYIVQSFKDNLALIIPGNLPDAQ